MKSYDLVELAGRNLREAVLRNSLTTMGISVGVASLVAMLSLGVGLQALAGKQLGRSGLFDSIVVSSKQDFRSQDERRQNRIVQTGEFKALDDTARQQFSKMNGVLDVYPDIRVMAETRFLTPGDKEEKSHFGMMAGLPGSARGSEVFDELQGSFFSGPMAEETIILDDFARELLNLPDDTRPIEQRRLNQEQLNQLMGKTITLRYAERQENAKAATPVPARPTDDPLADQASGMLGFTVVRKEKPLKIVGVVPTEPYGGMRGGVRGKLFIPTELAENLKMIQPTDLRAMMRPSTGKSYFTLVVKLKSSSSVKEVQDKIKGLGFSTFSIQDASKGLERFFRILDMFLLIFGSLALAVASLGIINTLVMAILERRREIGIMKALGASDMDVKKLFFVEAGAMGVLGGLVGSALGWAIGRVINIGTNIYMQQQDIPPQTFWVVPWWLVGFAMVISVGVSLIAGMYPAARAAKLDPVQALRHE
ncbi:MAG TPA: FtsX-like permease family protein [Terriglobales bacterium]|nr:FtsX-like permease family protein [Terriglobales bacterium]